MERPSSSFASKNVPITFNFEVQGFIIEYRKKEAFLGRNITKPRDKGQDKNNAQDGTQKQIKVALTQFSFNVRKGIR